LESAIDGGDVMKRRLAGIVTAIAISVSASAATAASTVIVDGVTIEGVVSSVNTNVDVFFGIPYGTAARWSPPVAHAPLSNPFDAKFATVVPTCPQDNTILEFGVPLLQSEDCLFLNIFVPASAMPTSKLPVLFWIHGGELQLGTGVVYANSNLVAATDIILVTINYRLGALGWLAHSSLRAAAANTYQNVGDAGDYGLMDQQFAMSWVKKNIAAFGGDPSKVTIAGQSAGGLSVSLNLASPTTAKGLFRGAIVESGSYMVRGVTSQAVYESEFGDAFVNGVLAATGTVGGVKCSSLRSSSAAAEVRKCLDGASVATLLTQQAAVFGEFGIAPNSGTRVLPKGPFQAFSAGAFVRVPVIQGINANEGRAFEPARIPLATSFATVVAAGGAANYDLTHANKFCGGIACTYLKEIKLYLAEIGVPSTVNTATFDATLANTIYPLKNFPDQYIGGKPSSDEGLAQISTDLTFACNVLDSNTELAKFVAVHAYELNDPLAPPGLDDPSLTKTPNDQYGYPTGSEHAAELNFLFNFFYTAELSAGERQLEANMWSYWTNFVKNLNPNTGASVPNWPAFGHTPYVQALVPGPVKKPSPYTTFGKEHFCSTWEPIVSTD
jgi:para-nitrobenzyl esterase